MTGRQSQEIATVECVAFDERADLRVDQGAERFECVEYKAMAMGFIDMKKADGETGPGSGKHCAKTASFAPIGEIQRGVDWVRRVTGAVCAETASSVSEGGREPRGQGPTGAGHELEAGPRNPAQRASYGLYTKDGVELESGIETGREIAELERSHAASSKIMPEFLSHDLTRNRRGVCRTLSADKASVLDRTRCDKGCQVAKPSGRKDSDAVIDAEPGGLHCERAAPTRKYDSLGFAMVRSGVEICCRAAFKIATAYAKRGSIPKYENIRADSGATVPKPIRCGVFLGRVLGCDRLPLAKFLAECGQGIGECSAGGVFAPKIEKGVAGVFGVLDGRPIGECAAESATGFGRHCQS